MGRVQERGRRAFEDEVVWRCWSVANTNVAAM